MSKENTESAEVNSEAGSQELTKLEQRRERNKGLTKGHGVVGMRKVTVSDLIDEIGEEPALDSVVFSVVIGVNEECRNSQDIRDVMRENCIMGTVYPMRNMPPVTQKEKTVKMFD